MQLQPHADAAGGAPVPGVTYKWYLGDTIFPFGTGLSYTTFAFAWCAPAAAAAVSADVAALAAHRAAPPSYCVNVTNTGAVVSDVSVLAFVASGAPDEPVEEVFSFGRLARLAPGEARALQFEADVGALASGRAPAGADARAPPGLWLWPGDYAIRIGDVRATGNFVATTLALRGDAPARLACAPRGV